MAIATIPVLLGVGDHASRPAANAVGIGGVYSCTDHNLIYQTDGSSWTTWATLGTTGAAPDSADYLVGTANGSLSGEIVVGATPGGELGNTWASPTVDATHSGSAHADFIAKAIVDVKGDIIVATAADTVVRLPAGTNGDVLTANSGVTEGVEWAAPASGGGVTVEDEGTPLSTTATTLDFVGAGVTATGSGATKTITIPGGGSGLTQAYVGYNTVGGTFDTGFNVAYYYAKKITLANACLLTDVQLHVQQTADANVNNVRFALFDDNGSGTAPNTLLWIDTTDTDKGLVLEDTSSGPRIARWISCAVGRWLPAGDYWAAWNVESTILSVAYDDTGTDDLYMNPAGGQMGDWGLWGTGTATDRCYSLRANTIR